MREEILQALIKAMKNKDKERVSVLRMIKGAMQLEELNQKRQLDDIEMSILIGKQIKSRKDSIDEFKKAKRDDLIQKTMGEINILEEYMIEQMSEAEVKEKVLETISKIGAKEKKDMGRVMKELSVLKGKADMEVVHKIVKENLDG